MAQPAGPSARRPFVLVFRADGSAQTGIGHVMRSLTLAAAALRRGHHVELHSAEIPLAVLGRAQQLQVPVIAVPYRSGSAEDARRLGESEADLICIDGYRFGDEFMDTLGHSRPMVMAIDDNREISLSLVRIVLNQNPHATAAMYGDLGPCRLLLGLDYALIRDEVLLQRAARTTKPTAQRVFVSIGGADALGITPRVIEALLGLPQLDVSVVVGSANPRGDEVRQIIASRPGRVREIQTEDLPGALAGADLAVVAAGGTLWEAATLGVPTVGLIVAENQAAAALSLPRNSFVAVSDLRSDPSMGQVVRTVAGLIGDAPRRAAMGAAGMALVDGRGAERVVEHIEVVLLESCERATSKEDKA